MKTIDKLRQLYPTLAELDKAKFDRGSWNKLAQFVGCNPYSIKYYRQELEVGKKPTPEEKTEALFPTREDFEHYLGKLGSEAAMGSFLGVPNRCVKQRRVELFGNDKPKKTEIINPNIKPVMVYHITDMAAFAADEIGSYDHLKFVRHEKPKTYSQVFGFNGRAQGYE